MPPRREGTVRAQVVAQQAPQVGSVENVIAKGVGEGVAQAGQILSTYAQAKRKAEHVKNETQTFIDAERFVGEKLAQYNMDPTNYARHEDDFKAEFTKFSGEIAAGISDEASRDAIMRKLNSTLPDMEARVRSISNKQMVDVGRATYNEALEMQIQAGSKAAVDAVIEPNMQVGYISAQQAQADKDRAYRLIDFDRAKGAMSGWVAQGKNPEDITLPQDLKISREDRERVIAYGRDQRNRLKNEWTLQKSTDQTENAAQALELLMAGELTQENLDVMFQETPFGYRGLTNENYKAFSTGIKKQIKEAQGGEPETDLIVYGQLSLIEDSDELFRETIKNKNSLSKTDATGFIDKATKISETPLNKAKERAIIDYRNTVLGLVRVEFPDIGTTNLELKPDSREAKSAGRVGELTQAFDQTIRQAETIEDVNRIFDQVNGRTLKEGLVVDTMLTRPVVKIEQLRHVLPLRSTITESVQTDAETRAVGEPPAVPRQRDAESTTQPIIPVGAVNDLLANPGTRDQFDAIFGEGASDAYLGGR